MSLITIENLTFSYGGVHSPVFENLNLNIDGNWKLGVIGENGAGKSTLLKLICGEETGSGKISAGTGFIRYPLNISDFSLTPLEIAKHYLPVYDEWKLFREAGRIGLEESALEREYAALSGGERTKFQLALAFSSEGFPLVDEPTDHLDADGRKRLAEYLSGKRGFIVVSHDRTFLDIACDRILSLEKNGVRLVHGNYSVYSEERGKILRADGREREKLEKERVRLNASSKRISEWAVSAEREKVKGSGKRDGKRISVDKGYLGAKAARIQKRAGAVAARRNEAEEELKERLKEFRETEDLRLQPLEYFKKDLLVLRDISVSVAEKELLKGFSLTVSEGERIAVIGGNGTGKSTLFKVILGIVSCAGERIVSERLKISYIPQIAEYCGTLGEYAQNYGIEESYFKALLAKFGFGAEDFGRDMSEFSEGQKKKAALARSLCEQANLYIWDEPLNYLDIIAREQLERAVVSSRATLLFTEHDAAFVKNVATRVIKL